MFPAPARHIGFAYAAQGSDRPYGGERGSSQPIISDPSLRLELVSEGLQLPTQMAFIGPNDILVLEKDNGIVKRIVNGVILEEPVLDVNVATAYERGLLGVAIAENDSDNDNDNDTTRRNSNIVYLYYTESEQDANDDCSDTGSCSKENEPLGNRLYRYGLVDNKLVNPRLLLDLPTSSGAVHNGGSILRGPDNNIYLSIGEVGYQAGQISNNDDGPPPDRRGGILRVTQQGEAVQPAILGTQYPLGMYYAYGIRNSFGMDFDPVTNMVWDTENGPSYGDEINLIEPGFNSGWLEVQGMAPVDFNYSEDLVNFEGKGNYSDPEFVWTDTVGPTAIKFLHSDRLGKQYENDVFVSDITQGNIYHFDLDINRTQLVLEGALADRVSNNGTENEDIIFGEGFGGISDLEVGPYDGYLYIVSLGHGSIYRIVPQ